MSKLRHELETRHCDERENAANKMAEKTNIALKECEAKWHNENSKLIRQVSIVIIIVRVTASDVY